MAERDRRRKGRPRDLVVGAGLVGLVIACGGNGNRGGPDGGSANSGVAAGNSGSVPASSGNSDAAASSGNGSGLSGSSTGSPGSGADAASSGSSGDDSGSGGVGDGGSPGGDDGSAPSEAGRGSTIESGVAGDGGLPPCVGQTHQGDLQIDNAADLAAAQPIVCVNGAVLLYLTSPTDITLPALQGVTGNVVLSNNSSVTSASFPMLVSAGGFQLTQSQALATVSAPALTFVGTGGISLDDDTVLTRVDIGSVAAFAGTLSVQRDPALPSLSVPHLAGSKIGITIVDDTVLTQVDISSVTESNGVRITGDTLLARVDMPLLTDAPFLGVDISGPAITAILLPRLTTAATITLGGTALAQVDLTSLQTSTAGLGVGDVGNKALTSLALPSFTTTQTFGVTADNLTSLSVPKLAKVTEVQLLVTTGPLDAAFPLLADATGGSGLRMPTAGVRSLSLPALVKGAIDVSFSNVVALSLPQLVSGDFIKTQDDAALQSISAPLLTTLNAESDIQSSNALTSLALPSLTSGGSLYVESDPALTAIDLHQMATAADLRFFGLPIASLSAPALTTVGDYIEINNNASLTSLNFPALTSCGYGIMMSGNTALATLNTPMLTSAQQLDIFNTLLTDMNAFSRIHGAFRELEIGSNPNLTDITGLYGVTSDSGYFTITNNTMLTTANANALRDHIGVGNITGTITISGNAP